MPERSTADTRVEELTRLLMNFAGRSELDTVVLTAARLEAQAFLSGAFRSGGSGEVPAGEGLTNEYDAQAGFMSAPASGRLMREGEVPAGLTRAELEQAADEAVALRELTGAATCVPVKQRGRSAQEQTYVEAFTMALVEARTVLRRGDGLAALRAALRGLSKSSDLCAEAGGRITWGDAQALLAATGWHRHPPSGPIRDVYDRLHTIPRPGPGRAALRGQEGEGE